VRMLTNGGISNSFPINYEWNLDIEVVVMSKNEIRFGQPKPEQWFTLTGCSSGLPLLHMILLAHHSALIPGAHA
jgi:hypothetical protein